MEWVGKNLSIKLAIVAIKSVKNSIKLTKMQKWFKIMLKLI